jgi:hypothetical protein
MLCNRCYKEVLKRNEFAAEVQKLGLSLDAGGNIVASGKFTGFSYNNATNNAQELANAQAIQCKLCSKVFCLDCLVKYANNHSRGGKACFSCGGDLQQI